MREWKRPESVLVVVATKSQKILCLLRADHPHFWQSITGSVQEGEAPEAAALRELHEETGIEAKEGILVDCQCSVYFDIYPHWRHRYHPDVKQNLEHVFCFFLETEQNIKLSHEHTKYCWLSKEEAIKTMASPSNQTAIEKFILEHKK
jgi:dATP pyrophosphohydrolase